MSVFSNWHIQSCRSAPAEVGFIKLSQLRGRTCRPPFAQHSTIEGFDILSSAGIYSHLWCVDHLWPFAITGPLQPTAGEGARQVEILLAYKVAAGECTLYHAQQQDSNLALLDELYRNADAHSLRSAGEMATEGEDVKVKPEGASSVINIVVKDQNSGEVHFKVGLSIDFLRAFSHTRFPHHILLGALIARLPWKPHASWHVQGARSCRSHNRAWQSSACL